MGNLGNRRAFIRKLGAGASAGLAATAGMAGATPATADDPALKAARLEEERVLRRLHQAFEEALDKGMHGRAIDMFADDAAVIFNGGVFRGRSQGVSRLFRERFPAWKTGGWMEPAPGFEPAADSKSDSVEISADLRSATAVFPYSIQVGMPFETDNSHAAMARLQGEGVQTWWEGGVYRVAYRKSADGRWQISQLEYDTLSRADWRAGRSYAQPIAVARFAARFPVDQQGPDELV